MKILTVLGARPQFIKASVVSRAIASSGDLSEIVVHTGQHFDANMSAVFFAELGMAPPAHALGVHGGLHGEMTGRMLAAIERVLLSEVPDVVLVYGDTNSTLAGALAAVKLRIPVAHVEAGLRSHNLEMPEEVNRVLTDRVSRWLFAPTNAAVANLRTEGVAPERIFSVGDVMYDVALYYGKRVAAAGGVLKRLQLRPGQYVLATVHRAENTDDDLRLRTIVESLVALAKEVQVVWPVHPRTRLALERIGCSAAVREGLVIVDPLGYLEMVQLEKYAALIATDSGGVQKEAFFHEVPCVTLREETEWVELVSSGWNRLAPPTNADEITAVLLGALGTRGAPSRHYGDGDAAGRIVEHLANYAR